MVVVTLEDCPLGLRGDLTKWLLEIQSGVFVGNVSARVRDLLWDRIKGMCKSGRAVMVYSTNGEQRLNFKTLGGTWEPIDFDGIKLMLRPSSSRLKEMNTLKSGFSKVAKRRLAQRMTNRQDKVSNATPKSRFPVSYVVVDVETTGLNSMEDEIIEIAALKVQENRIHDILTVFIRTKKPVSTKIAELTGITDSALSENGVELSLALMQFLEFAGTLPVVAHNVDFDYKFLRTACSQCGIPLFSNKSIDTLSLSKRVVRGVKNYKLLTLAEHFGLEQDVPHRGINDCRTTQRLYEKLVELLESESRST
jgi:CRISPR-associated protein Cas2